MWLDTPAIVLKIELKRDERVDIAYPAYFLMFNIIIVAVIPLENIELSLLSEVTIFILIACKGSWLQINEEDLTATSLNSINPRF